MLLFYNDNSFDGITNNVVAYAKVILDSRYQIESIKEVSNYPRYNASSQVWTGKLKITKRTDENDTKTFVVSVNINDNETGKALSRVNEINVETYGYEIVLLEKDYYFIKTIPLMFDVKADDLINIIKQAEKKAEEVVGKIS